MSKRFSPAEIALLRDARILGVRSGFTHRHTNVWLVVVRGRLFVRSWNDEPNGWFRAFLSEPRGSIRFGIRELPVRAIHTRSLAVRELVTAAYASKYQTKASRKWVIGFAVPSRAACTLEFVPA